MVQGCLKCLKYTMCVVNFLCFLSGTVVFGFGVYLMMNSKVSSLLPTLSTLNLANTFFITGIIITCVSFLGFLGALKENRCLLITFFMLLFILMVAELAAACLLLIYEKGIDSFLDKELKDSLVESKKTMGKGNSTTINDDWDFVHKTFNCCGIHNASDWGDNVPQSCCPKTATCEKKDKYKVEGCYKKLKTWFEENFLSTGIGVIVLCIIEVLGMCFSMTLFCHISRTGLGYKL